MDNVPTPLRGAPIPLLCDGESQMSFAERAVLEGVLSQLRPQIAIELGTAAGGSTRRIARHSGIVHSFDLSTPTWALSHQERNVRFYTGDSRGLLPQFLREARVSIDFVLVDGDHSTAGVQADLTAILESPWCRQTVILLHDSAHPETREGILAALTDASHVVYEDIDFLPGYRFTKGGFQGQPWGGFALVVTGLLGTRQSQDLYRPI